MQKLFPAPVMVTGASGYVASWIVKTLLDAGATVHATVRDPARAESVAHLTAAAAASPGKLVLFKADLLVPGSFDAAAAGCEVVLHTASPFLFGSLDDPQKQLLTPALEGTRNVLGSVERTPSVKRVVLTSSVAAVYGDAAELAHVPGGVFSEAHWNETSSLHHNPYQYSKVCAEREAWKIAHGQARWDLVVVNPGLVLGPSLTTHSQSYSIDLLRALGSGRYRVGVPELWFGCVDVRDVALAHVRAACTASASGRYIVSGQGATMLELARLIGLKYPSKALPRRKLFKASVWLLGPISAGITRKFVSLNVGLPVRFDASRSARDLGMQYRPLADTVQEQYAQLVRDGEIRGAAAA
jgi:nucleoside-diphosphate-sugar epimerase